MVDVQYGKKNIDDIEKNDNIDTKLIKQLEQERQLEQELEEFVNPKTINPYLIVGFVWIIGFMLSFIIDFVLKS